jgi:AbrB family looped-hinge helix DNA binding protein
VTCSFHHPYHFNFFNKGLVSIWALIDTNYNLPYISNMARSKNIPKTKEIAGSDRAFGRSQYLLRIGPQGRIVIPAPIRKALGLIPGAVVMGRIEDGKVVLSRSNPLEELRAMFKNAKFSSKTLTAERRREARKDAEELERD